MHQIEVISWYILFYFLMFIFEREREREHEHGGAERGGQRIQSQLHADSRKLDVGLEPMNSEIMI